MTPRELAAGAALFRISYGAGQSGTYALESLRYTYGGVETAVNFADIGIDAAFGVDAAAESSPRRRGGGGRDFHRLRQRTGRRDL